MRNGTAVHQNLCDISGRPYATVADTKAGDRITVDDGFTCIALGTERIICENEDGLYFLCREGHHYLAVQKSAGGTCYIGVYPLSPTRAEGESLSHESPKR